MIGSASATPVMEQTQAIERGWIWGNNAAGQLIADEGHKANTYRTYRRDATSATATIYTSNASVGASYYLETRTGTLKAGTVVYTITETWRNEGAWATNPIL